MKRNVIFSREALETQCAEAGVCLPYSEDTEILAEPVTVGTGTAANRLACQAMEGCDGNPDGTPGELTRRRYGRLARGGAAVIWFEATAVLPEAKANPRQLYITRENAGEFRRQADAIREEGLRANGYAPLIFLQATHSGRYSKPEGVPAPLIAWPNPILEKERPVDPSRVVTDEYLDRVGDALVEGAALAELAGFDGVDIKCCHRYLNSELLSAYERPGKYGGSLENRSRLLRESIAGARQVCSADFLVSTRMNAYDGFPYPYGFGVKLGGGIAPDLGEAAWILAQLRNLGVKIVNITMGNPYFNPHVNRPFAQGPYEPKEPPVAGVARMLDGTAELKRAVPELKIICSGLSYLGTAAPNVCAAYVRQGGFDFAGFGRTVLAYPDFARDILAGGMQKSRCCLACSKCSEIMRTPGGTPGCVLRDPVYTQIYRDIFGKKD